MAGLIGVARRSCVFRGWRTSLPIVLTLVAASCSGGTSNSTPPPSRPAATLGRIAFAGERDGNAEIYVMNADGTGVERLTNDPGDDGFPAWSPDGTEIAFASDRNGGFEIYVMNAEGRL